MCWKATITKCAVAWVGSVQPECTVPLSRWSFRNFKPELLLNGKRPIWTALKPVCLATAPVIQASLLTIFTAWALINQLNFDRVINSHHFQLQGEFWGNLQCCNSFTGKKIVSYIKAEDGPVFTVYSEVRYVAKHCNRLKLTRYSYTARVIFPYSNIQIIFYAFKLTCKLKSYVSIPFTSTVCVK